MNFTRALGRGTVPCCACKVVQYSVPTSALNSMPETNRA